MSGEPYALFMRAYPKEYRAAHGSEIVGTLLEAGVPGRRTPSLREAAWLVAGGLKVRLHATTERGSWWTDGLHLGVLVLALLNLPLNLGLYPYWFAGSALLVLALLRGWVWMALPLALVSVFQVSRPLVFGAHLMGVVPIFGPMYGDWPDILQFGVVAAGLIVLVTWRGMALRPERRLRPRSWKWLALAALLVIASTHQTGISSHLEILWTILEGSLMLVAIWATAMTADARWLLAAVVYLLPAIADLATPDRLSLLSSAYWDVLGLLVLAMATAVVTAGRQAERVL